MTTTNHTRDKRLLTCSELGRVPRQNKGSLPYYVFPLEKGGGWVFCRPRKDILLIASYFSIQEETDLGKDFIQFMVDAFMLFDVLICQN